MICRLYSKLTSLEKEEEEKEFALADLEKLKQ